MKKVQQQPLVSVIMPVYNAQKYLAEAMESIVAQTYPNWELVVVDDASTDNSWKILQRFQKRYPNKIVIKRLHKNRNMGGDAAANEAFKLTKGQFIARMDADDIAHPKRLEKQITYLHKYPDIAVLGTNATVIDAMGKTTGKKYQPHTHQDIYNQYYINHPMINPSIMFQRKELLTQRQLYIIAHDHNNDLYTFFNMLIAGKRFGNLKQPLLYYRVHDNNDSLKAFKKCYWVTLEIRIHAFRSGYKPTFKAVLMNMVQLGAILLLPESLIKTIFLFMRGMIQIHWKKKIISSKYLLNNIKALALAPTTA